MWGRGILFCLPTCRPVRIACYFTGLLRGLNKIMAICNSTLKIRKYFTTVRWYYLYCLEAFVHWACGDQTKEKLNPNIFCIQMFHLVSLLRGCLFQSSFKGTDLTSNTYKQYKFGIIASSFCLWKQYILRSVLRINKLKTMPDIQKLLHNKS
jgi:hypothetical protein